MTEITVFRARKIITMDPCRPVATHVAVRGGRILAVGDKDCAAAWGRHSRDQRLADSVLMPGLVEGHAHLMAGRIWTYPYVGYHDRIDPDGGLVEGHTELDAVIASLRKAAARLGEGEPLVAWGFDPIFLPGRKLQRHHLDRVSTTRPVAVIFSNFHLMCVNSAVLELVGYSEATNVPGVIRASDGTLTGELHELAALFPVMRRMGIDFRSLGGEESAIRSFANVARRAGVTTATDLYSTLRDSEVEALLGVTGDERFPLRIVPALAATAASPEEIADRALALRSRSSDKLRLGAVKLMTDGSIQGRTARLKWPGYLGQQRNGIWNTAPEQVFALCETMQREGVQMHIHVNGDEASEVALDALEAAMRKHPWPGHRHVLQHGQMMGRAQFLRCAEIGVCANLFANQIWYFGDQHLAHTIGEDRGERMNACRSALDAGVCMAIHSDAPVTPLGPLFSAWCAVNRRTMSGRILGEAQKITVAEALHAVTLGAAATLKLDSEIGSIETGKIADFAILGDDPTTADPEALKDVPVLGTVTGGRVNPL